MKKKKHEIKKKKEDISETLPTKTAAIHAFIAWLK